jgi:hypothetical protein
MTDSSKKSITEKQRQARRENGKKSRGPTSRAGKAQSSQNSTKHGGYARGLRAIQAGPLREDPDAMRTFVGAYVAELDPGDSVILFQAALDVADKAWRLTRAQRWEAEGYSGADYVSVDAAQAGWLRHLADRDRREADVVRLLPDSEASRDDLLNALCNLGFAVGLSEEDLDWTDDGDRAAVAEGLTALIENHFAGTEEAASFLESRATEREAEASGIESMWRPTVIRNEMDGSFARNAERLVSHASREFDRSLKRYGELYDRLRHVDDDQPRDDNEPAQQNGGGMEPSGGLDPQSGGGPDMTADKSDIWSEMTADEVAAHIRNLLSGSVPAPPPRNEPTEGNIDM